MLDEGVGRMACRVQEKELKVVKVAKDAIIHLGQLVGIFDDLAKLSVRQITLDAQLQGQFSVLFSISKDRVVFSEYSLDPGGSKVFDDNRWVFAPEIADRGMHGVLKCIAISDHVSVLSCWHEDG